MGFKGCLLKAYNQSYFIYTHIVHVLKLLQEQILSVDKSSLESMLRSSKKTLFSMTSLTSRLAAARQKCSPGCGEYTVTSLLLVVKGAIEDTSDHRPAKTLQPGIKDITRDISAFKYLK